MKKISNINEGWGAMIKRDITSDVREEDRSPWDEWFKTVNWIDMGNDVLWADKFFPIDDLNGRDFTDALKSDAFERVLKKYGAKIPEPYDFIYLQLDSKKNRDKSIKSTLNGNVLKFNAPSSFPRIDLVCFPLRYSNNSNRDTFRVFHYCWNVKFEDSNVSTQWFTKYSSDYVKVILIKKVQK